MKLRPFIQKLNHLQKLHGGDVAVLMADYIPVVDPRFFEDSSGKAVFITDRK